MKRTMMRIFLTVVGVFLSLLSVTFGKPAFADGTPEVVVIEVAPVATPEPIVAPEREIEVREYNPRQEDVDTLARLMWSSPLRDAGEKENLLWVVLNRVDSDEFADTIDGVCVKCEFSFFDSKAHISEKNIEIARRVLNAWYSEKDGCYVGSHVPATGLYIRFIGENNRGIVVTAEKGGEPLEW